MSEPLFDVVYAGDIIAPDRTQVIEAFASLFKLDIPRAEKILSSTRKVLKRNVSEAQGRAYVKRLSSIGVLVSLEAKTVGAEAVIELEPEGEAPSQPGEAPFPDNRNESPGPGNTGTAATASKADARQLSVAEVEESGPGNTNFAAIEDTGRVKRLNFSFTGNGAEFFKIWVVNVLLSIITLGIYSAWAKVRTNRYFYSNTRLDNASFEYLAEPLTILKGRIVAVVLFATYSLTQQFFPLLSPILLVLFLLFLPWLIAVGLRFRMRNTAYRNIRFGFEGSVWEAAKAYSLMFLLVPVTLGLIVPFMLYMQNRYRVDNTRYGVDHFAFAVSPRAYYRIYLMASLAILATGILGVLFSAATPVLGGLVFVAGYALVMTYIKVETINLMFDNSHLGDHSFSSTLELWPYFNLYFVNTLMMILTLGLFYPWAKVRIARYRADNLLMLAQDSLNYYVATQEQETTAIGEEVGDIFDFEMGF